LLIGVQCNEDAKIGKVGARAAAVCVANDASSGLMAASPPANKVLPSPLKTSETKREPVFNYNTVFGSCPRHTGTSMPNARAATMTPVAKAPREQFMTPLRVGRLGSPPAVKAWFLTHRRSIATRTSLPCTASLDCALGSCWGDGRGN
jgi:hypothetical protein